MLPLPGGRDSSPALVRCRLARPGPAAPLRAARPGACAGRSGTAGTAPARTFPRPPLRRARRGC